MRIPLHERIRVDFETQILTGRLAPGARLPIEQEIMQQYGCSRMTVNKALSTLAAAGLIESRKRAGTFVSRPRMHSMVLDVPDMMVQIREREQDYIYRLLVREIRVPRSDHEGERSLAGGGKLLQLDGVHLADGQPLGVEYRLISLNSVPEMADADLENTAPGSWLLQHVPWTEAETRISAVGAVQKEADVLNVPIGTPCLSVERHTWRGDLKVTNVRQILLGTAYDLTARFGPTSFQR